MEHELGDGSRAWETRKQASKTNAAAAEHWAKMATVHNRTPFPVNFTYTLFGGGGFGNIAVNINNNVIVANIGAGMVHASFGPNNIGAWYPGVHLDNIYVVSTVDDPALIAFAQ